MMVGYVYFRDLPVTRTVQVTDSLLVDLDSNDTITGIETLGDASWQDALVTLAMSGRLTIPVKGDLWP